MQQRPYISDGLRACREGRGEPKREEVEKWREVQYTNLPTCIFISYGGQESDMSLDLPSKGMCGRVERGEREECNCIATLVLHCIATEYEASQDNKCSCW